jgi:hypothetical protein
MLQHEGKKYARVSEILSPFNDFSKILPNVLSRKALIGTNVHSAIDDEISGVFPCLREEEISYFNSFIGWKDKVNPKFIERETRYYNDEKMITGRIDALIKFKDIGRPVLLDFKTSAQESPIVWPMQAHLYAYLLKKAGKEISDIYLFVKLDKFGKLPKVFVYKYQEEVMEKCHEAIETFWKNFRESQ